MKLSDYMQDRDNNFNLIRILAAFAVLLTHCFALTLGQGPHHGDSTQLASPNLGSIAVDVFFVVSGFLVTGSLLARRNLVEFIWARLLRVFPALLVMVLLVVFVLGPVFTTASLPDYFSDPATHRFLSRNSTLFDGVTFVLPGVFAANPYPSAVNGSLWSMPFEVRMYAVLVVLWLALRWLGGNRQKAFEYCLFAIAIVAGAWKLSGHAQVPWEPKLARLGFAFFTGAVFHVLKERIVFSRRIFWLVICALAVSTLNRYLLFVVYSLTLAYPVLYLAHVPGGWIRKYNRVGDYSYGVYIYAFPVQQSIVALFPGQSPLSLFLRATPVTLALAGLSWHLLERHALGLKGFWVGQTRRLLNPAADRGALIEPP